MQWDTPKEKDEARSRLVILVAGVRDALTENNIYVASPKYKEMACSFCRDS